MDTFTEKMHNPPAKGMLLTDKKHTFERKLTYKTNVILL
jgi:hypothetical protein